MDRFFFWFQLVKSCLIRLYPILHEQRFTICSWGGWWKMIQLAVGSGGLWECYLHTQTSLPQAMPQDFFFLRWSNIITWNVMRQEVEKPFYIHRDTQCVSLWIHLERERSLVTELWWRRMDSSFLKRVTYIFHLHCIINYILQLLGQSDFESLIRVVSTKQSGHAKFLAQGGCFLYENPWILCMESSFFLYY